MTTERFVTKPGSVLDLKLWLTETELLHRFHGAKPRAWCEEERLFSVDYLDGDRFPVYALDLVTGKPLKVVAHILDALSAQMNDWDLALWFAAPNAFLAGQRPQDKLADAPEAVLAAARDEALFH